MVLMAWPWTILLGVFMLWRDTTREYKLSVKLSYCACALYDVIYYYHGYYLFTITIS